MVYTIYQCWKLATVTTEGFADASVPINVDTNNSVATLSQLASDLQSGGGLKVPGKLNVLGGSSITGDESITGKLTVGGGLSAGGTDVLDRLAKLEARASGLEGKNTTLEAKVAALETNTMKVTQKYYGLVGNSDAGVARNGYLVAGGGNDYTMYVNNNNQWGEKVKSPITFNQ